MLYARVGGDVLHAIHTQENTAVCPTCDWEVRAKRGTVVAHHWAHAPGASCDPWKSSAMSKWHWDWQERFPRESREFVLERHRADVLLKSEADPDDFQVIEFQNSSISEVDRQNREDFWGDVIWVLNGPILSDGFRISNTGALWLPRLKLAQNGARVFVDMLDGYVYERLGRTKRRTYDEFVALRMNWELERAHLRAEAKERTRRAQEEFRLARLAAIRAQEERELRLLEEERARIEEEQRRREDQIEREVIAMVDRERRALADAQYRRENADRLAAMVERERELRLERETREAAAEAEQQAIVEAEEKITSKNLEARERRVRVERGMELAARTLAWDEANPDVAHKTNMALRELLLDRDPESPLLAEGGRCWVAEETLSATA